MRYLRNRLQAVGLAYLIHGVQEELDRRGFTAYDQPSSSFIIFSRRVAVRLKANVLLNPFPRDPMLAIGALDPDRACFPTSLWTRIIPYFCDCWERDFLRWESFFVRHRTEMAFLTARYSAAYFQQRFPSRRFVWLPESVDLSAHPNAPPLANRTIDVLELGRKYDAFHNRLSPLLSAAGMSHLYEKVKGEIIFSSRENFVAGMANSRVSVCFPQSLTNPEWAGNVETATLRYFESMASKCLIVGKCPLELRDLFGYNPVIEVTDPAEVLDIVRNIAEYQTFVEKNYMRLCEVGTHSARVESLIKELRAAGFSAP